MGTFILFIIIAFVLVIMFEEWGIVLAIFVGVFMLAYSCEDGDLKDVVGTSIVAEEKDEEKPTYFPKDSIVTATIKLDRVRSYDWENIADTLRLSDELFQYNYADIVIIIDSDLNIVGGKVY